MSVGKVIEPLPAMEQHGPVEHKCVLFERDGKPVVGSWSGWTKDPPHPDRTLLQCSDCGRWWKFRAVLEWPEYHAPDPNYSVSLKPVCWWNFKDRKQVRTESNKPGQIGGTE